MAEEKVMDLNEQEYLAADKKARELYGDEASVKAFMAGYLQSRVDLLEKIKGELSDA